MLLTDRMVCVLVLKSKMVPSKSKKDGATDSSSRASMGHFPQHGSECERRVGRETDLVGEQPQDDEPVPTDDADNATANHTGAPPATRNITPKIDMHIDAAR
jgi:hypothetical protein